MAAARDQAARILRPEPDPAEGEHCARRCGLPPTQAGSASFGTRLSAVGPQRRRINRPPSSRLPRHRPMRIRQRRNPASANWS